MSKKKTKALTPPDRKRCQAEDHNGAGPFTVGGRPGWDRCINKPTSIVVETEDGPDGQRGSMSLCDRHYEEFSKRHDMQKHGTYPLPGNA